MDPSKRVVYIVVDGMGVDPLEQAAASGSAPGLAFLKEHSSYVRDSVAVFPTITPAATASLITGATPARHRIPGMCWYDRDAQRFVNYGQSPRVAVVEGASQIVEDALGNLNRKHLSPDVETLHESLGRLGLTTASINYMVFRGPYIHRLQPGLLERLLLRKRLPRELPGPIEHYFADVIEGPAGACLDLPRRGLEKRLKATDGWAACVTRDLLEKEVAHMILFYLHENDHISHRSGPSSQVDNLIEADAHIRHVLGTYGSWEETLDRVGFVLTADHAQSPISDQADHIIDLHDPLDGFTHVSTGRGKESFGNRDIAWAGNGRVAFIYLNEDRTEDLRTPVVDALAGHPGTDQVMWKEEDSYVVHSDRGRLRFRPGGQDQVVDERDNKWSFEGDLAAVSGVVEDGRLRTPEYPLAFWRIREALDLDRMGDVVVTPKLTYEFRDLGGGDHRGGGDHASLHVQDSLVPFMSTLDAPPLHPTTVDVAPHILNHFQNQS
ncbi:MAG: alkaline phosphatase family protein [Actinomycetota bacterium]